MDHKQVIKTIMNLNTPFIFKKVTKKADKFKGNKQYPKRQRIWKILDFTPKKLAFKYIITPPIQKITKIKIII